MFDKDGTKKYLYLRKSWMGEWTKQRAFAMVKKTYGSTPPKAS